MPAAVYRNVVARRHGMSRREDGRSFLPGLRATLDGLSAVHQGTELASDAGLGKEAVTATHPVVRTHPETGRRALYVNDNYTVRFDRLDGRGQRASVAIPVLAGAPAGVRLSPQVAGR